jgi:hypothetical protein
MMRRFIPSGKGKGQIVSRMEESSKHAPHKVGVCRILWSSPLITRIVVNDHVVHDYTKSAKVFKREAGITGT